MACSAAAVWKGFSGVGVGGFGARRRCRRQSAGAGIRVHGRCGCPSRRVVTSVCCKRRRSSAINIPILPRLGDSLEQLQAANDAGRIDRFQVDLARQALYNAQSQLLNNENTYADGLDNFKLLYGIAAVAWT